MNAQDFLKNISDNETVEGMTFRKHTRYMITLLEPMFHNNFNGIIDILKLANYDTLSFDNINILLRLTCRIRDIAPEWELSYRRAYDSVKNREYVGEDIFFGYGHPKV